MTNRKTGQGNGQPQPTLNVEQQKELDALKARFVEITNNVLQTRTQFMQQFLDPRRDLNKECGYPDVRTVDPDFYRNLYDSEGIATRVVNVLPQECWQEQPTIYEDEDEENITEFEQGVLDLSKNLRGDSWYKDENITPIWEMLKRVDELSGIGRFGVLLFGFDDGLSLEQPVPGLENVDSGDVATIQGFDQDQKEPLPIPRSIQGTDAQYTGTQFAPYMPAKPLKKGERRKLIFLRAFDESLVQIVRYEANVYSPRFGLPVMYRITFNDPRNQHSGVGLPMATLMVHWSRVLHVADRLGSSEIFGYPRMQCSLHRLLDIAKLYGGSAEMYWKGAFPGISFETHPQLGGEVQVDHDSIRAQMYEWQNDLQRFLLTTGMSAKTLAPQVVDPTPQIDTQLQGVCIEIGIPQRIFMGSERGELASSQDDKTWGMRIKFRQYMYLVPRVIVPFFDRLIKVGVLPEPAEENGYTVKWPQIDTLTETEKATVALQFTQALAAYVSGGLEQVCVLKDFLVNVMGLDSALAEQIVENAMSQEPAESATLPDPDNPVDEYGRPMPSVEEEQAAQQEQAQQGE